MAGGGPVFDNLDLHVGQGEGGVYPVTVQRSPAGETAAPVRVPMACDDEPMRRWRQGLQDGWIAAEELLALGRRLAGYLLPPGPVRDLYQRSLGMAEAGGLGLRLRLRIAPPELAALPWEYLYDEGLGDYVVLNPRTALVRYHSQPVPPSAIASYAPVPVLVVISNPPGTRALEIVAETRNLIQALDRLLDEDRVRIDVLLSAPVEERRAIEALVAHRAGARMLPGPASIDALRDALRQGVRVIHYIGHGVFDDRAGGALLLVDEEGAETLVGAQALARALRGTSAAVVVLNACQSATESTAHSFMGLAPHLIRAGVPAVVAMQVAIADRSALSFSRTLYEALADGWPLDAAVTEGRKAISALEVGEVMDWGIPVLFMRSEDGVLWQEEPGEMDEKVVAPEPEGGGVVFHGQAEIGGDVVGRDKIVYGDEVRGDKVAGDKIVGHVGSVGAGAQVAIGKQIQQTIAQAPPGLTAAECQELERMLAGLRARLAGLDGVPDRQKLLGQEFVGQLEQELTRTEEPPDGSVIKVAGDWLLKNVPALAGTLASIFLHPIVGKVVEAAGDIAANWVRERFGRI